MSTISPDRLAELLAARQGRTILALDGRSAAGKTTLAAALEARFSGAVIHMDDFFLPAALRTEQRLQEPGGNVHYERFEAEVLKPLAAGQPFSYGVFDCVSMAIRGRREVSAASLVIVEGAYSHHPRFGGYADLRVFFDVEPEEQMRRILRRSGPEKAEQFRTRWIPLEERYFRAYAIREKADYRLSSGG